MAEIKVDTIKMRECGNDIMQISNEIGSELDNLFDRITKMPIKTFEWTGLAAQAFASKAKLEKIQYVELKNSLYQYGKYLVEQANRLDGRISKLKDI